MKHFYSLCILFFCVFPLCGNTLQSFQDEDPVKSYISYRMKKMKSFDKLRFESGYLITKPGDTTRCQLSILQKWSDHFLFVIAKYENGEYKTLTSNDIFGYSIKGNTYISCKNARGIYYFLNLVEKGRITLYTGIIPFEEDYLKYYLQKEGEKRMYREGVDKMKSQATASGKIITVPGEYVPQGETIKVGETSFNLALIDLHNDFKQQMKKLLEDCFAIRNKVLAEFYMLDNMRLIVKEYNKCQSGRK